MTSGLVQTSRVPYVLWDLTDEHLLKVSLIHFTVAMLYVLSWREVIREYGYCPKMQPTAVWRYLKITLDGLH